MPFFFLPLQLLLAQCRFALVPDGLFLGALLGGDTLSELRAACTAASHERLGGVSPRTSPLARVRDAGNMLSASGLAIPTVDVDDVVVAYESPAHLVRHLARLAETAARGSAAPDPGPLPRDVALAAAAAYVASYGSEVGGAGVDPTVPFAAVPATYQAIYLAGWAPAPGQAKAARRGSATASFDDIKRYLGDGEDGGTHTEGKGA